MGTLDSKIPSTELADALNDAAATMRGLRQRVMMPEHLLLAFLDKPEFAAHRLLTHLAAERGFKLDQLTRDVEDQVRGRRGVDVDFDFVDASGQRVPLSEEMLVVLDEGRAIARSRDEIWVGTADALAAMSQRGVSTSGLLQRYGVTPTALSVLLVDAALARRTTTRDLVALAQDGELPPVHFREALLRDLLSLLSLARQRHVILVGPAGVGKRSLVHGLAFLIAEGTGPAGLSSVVHVTEEALFSDAARAVEAGMRQATGGVLFLPNVQRFFGGVLRAEFPKATPAVQRAFLSDQVVVIGTTTEGDLLAPGKSTRLEGSSLLAERAQQLNVPEPDRSETLDILRVHKPNLEADYGLRVDQSALEAAATLAKRYLAEAVLPAAAIQLLHRACALLQMGTQPHLAFRPEIRDDARLDDDDVTLAASLMTGIPVTRLGADERSRYARMVEHLHERIVGQEEAVLAVSRAVKTARVGLKDPRRPIGSFLFLGPTGVGKTELAKALAEFMFGEEEAMVVLDMSEYQQDHTVNRLIGAPPGYVGYESGGQLTDQVRERPYTVVLFDEVEKAHPRVLDVLLQIMEEGRLTDGQGRTAAFHETVVIMTSNIGSEFLVEPVLTEPMQERVMALVKATLRPEFLNRLDDIILFHPLSPDHLRQILELMLKKETRLAADRGLEVVVSEGAKDWMLARVAEDHPEWGARPLRRILRRFLREPLADFLLAADPPSGTRVRVDAGTDGLTFETG
jgi:ATP-dependent Clp protease ATP-binding subunit ClpC